VLTQVRLSLDVSPDGVLNTSGAGAERTAVRSDSANPARCWWDQGHPHPRVAAQSSSVLSNRI
jgi:hypothetical protein